MATEECKPRDPEETPTDTAKKAEKKWNPKGDLYDIVEMLAMVTIIVMFTFAFLIRLNIVDGISMETTLHNGEYLAVSDLFYTPEWGDIVIVHKINAGHYTNPLVKRVIATAGQTVDIDFDTWTLTVDGEVVDEESYRFLDPRYKTLEAEYAFPITVPEGHIFVLGDNRNCSADSRTLDIQTVDERCVVGKALVRLLPFGRFTVFENPYE